MQHEDGIVSLNSIMPSLRLGPLFKAGYCIFDCVVSVMLVASALILHRPYFYSGSYSRRPSHGRQHSGGIRAGGGHAAGSPGDRAVDTGGRSCLWASKTPAGEESRA